METETLTFDFGATPEEVIRERAAGLRLQIRGDADDIQFGYSDSDAAQNAADLLTVLDALALSATTVRYRTDRKDGSPMFNCDGEGNRLPDYMQRPGGQHEARRLRIEILAALGIKEGNCALCKGSGRVVMHKRHAAGGGGSNVEQDCPNCGGVA